MKLKVLFLLLFVASFFSHIACAQDDKTVSIKVTGSGKTPDEAKQAALRNAIEQAFGTFISAKTDILNDQVVSDQITSVSNGNIQKYEVLNETQLPGGGWASTLNAMVSVSKLTSFVQAKGITVEIKGGLFAINIKQQILNEQGEVRVIQDMMFLLHEPMLQAFDYSITSGEPKSLDTENKKWAISLEVDAKPNNNLDFVSKYLIKNLSSISLTDEEVANYRSLNKPVYSVSINGDSYSLRKKESIDFLAYFASRWSYYVKNFAISNGAEYSQACYVSMSSEAPHKFSKDYDEDAKFLSISFPIVGALVEKYIWSDALTLKDIEKITAYTVKPGYPMPVKAGQLQIGSYHAGGIVFFVDESGQHGFVVSPLDIGFNTIWGCDSESITGTSEGMGTGALNTKLITRQCKEHNNAANLCADLVANGYNDWFLPSSEELHLVSDNLGVKDLGYEYRQSQYPNYDYWSSTEGSRGSDKAVYFDFEKRESFYRRKDGRYDRTLVRPIRAF